MEETFSNVIRDKYNELIRLISLIGDDIKIEDKWSTLSLTIHVYSNKKELLSFKLYKVSETIDSLDVAWGVLGYNIGHWNFPDYFDQKYMFGKLVSVITNWQESIVNSNLGKVLEQAQDTENKIKKAFVKDWSLIDFAKEFGKMKVGKETIKATGEKFPSCRFYKGNDITFVSFYSRLGVLTPEEITENKYKLFVGQTANGNYYLHGENLVEWEDVTPYLDLENTEHKE